MKLLALIPAKIFAKYLPEIIGFILTKALGWLSKKYPEKYNKAKETSQEITVALADAVKAAEDGVISKEEVERQKKLWQAVFD